ncbi:2-oxoglutarate (2OG) and Fe(II)-dependent oxygenase superfamily protein [Tanacetum coccineum]
MHVSAENLDSSSSKTKADFFYLLGDRSCRITTLPFCQFLLYHSIHSPPALPLLFLTIQTASVLWDKPYAFLRLLRYISRGNGVVYGASAHSDYGMITLLATDAVPGLQAIIYNISYFLF